MYGDLVNNLKDRVIDGAIDSTLTSFKDNQILNKTYVWTAISKETYGGKIAYIVFINKNMFRRRVQYDQLGEFILNNYVSNVLVNDGKVSMVGMTFNDLPDINGYSRSRYTEQDIYNKAFPYIQSTQQKIYEDFNMKCLKGANMEEVHSNFSENLSNVKDTAQAVAFTAMTAAGTAAVTGIAVGATKIYKAANKQKLTELKIEIANQLINCSNLTEELIKVKQITNRKLQDDVTIIQYNSNIEAQNDQGGKVRGLILQYGMNGCISKVEGLINQCVAKADSNKILTESINSSGTNIGTIDAYSKSVMYRVNYLKQLHDNTKQIIMSNIQYKKDKEQRDAERRYLESQQTRIISELDADLIEVESKINDYNTDITDANARVKLKEFDRLDLDTMLTSSEFSVEQILDNNTKQQYVLRIRELKTRYNNTINILNNHIRNNELTIKNEIAQDLNDTDSIVENLIAGRIGGDNYINSINTVNSKITELRIKVNDVKDYDRETLVQRINSIETKLNSNRRALETGLTNAERDSNKVSEIKFSISKCETDIANAVKASEIKSAIDVLSKGTQVKLGYLKNSYLVEEWRQKVEDKISEFNQIYNSKLESEQRELESNIQILLDLIDEIKAETARIRAINIDNYTRTDLDNFIVDVDAYKLRIPDVKNERTHLMVANNAINELRNEYTKKRREITTMLDSEDRYMRSLTSKLDTIQAKINSRIDDSNNEKFKRELNSVRSDYNYLKIRDKVTVDTRINELTAML